MYPFGHVRRLLQKPDLQKTNAWTHDQAQISSMNCVFLFFFFHRRLTMRTYFSCSLVAAWPMTSCVPSYLKRKALWPLVWALLHNQPSKTLLNDDNVWIMAGGITKKYLVPGTTFSFGRHFTLQVFDLELPGGTNSMQHRFIWSNAVVTIVT